MSQLEEQFLLSIKNLEKTSQNINQVKQLFRKFPILTKFPNFMPAWIELGLIFRRRGDRISALNVFQSALNLAPNNQQVKLELSTEQLHCNKLHECRQNLYELLEINPRNVQALIKLGELYRRENNRKEALNLFQKVVNLDSKVVWARVHLAIELKFLGRFDEAEHQLKQALQSSPNHFNILMNLGYLERERGDQKQALQWFSLAQEKAHNTAHSLNAQLSAIEELRGLGRIEQALTNIESILTEFPHNIQAKLIYGTLLKQQLDFSNAVKLYESIIVIQPKNLQAQLELASCLSELNKTEEAFQILSEANNIYPDNPHIFKRIGNLYRKQQDRQQALKYYQKSLSIVPENITFLLDVAIELRELNNFEAAAQHIHQALEYHPNNLFALIEMSKLEQKRQQLNSALEYLKIAIENYPERIQLYLDKINILYDLGDIERAKNHFQTLLQKYPEEFRVLISYGHFCRKLGQRKKALQWFNLAQEKASNSLQNLEAQITAIEEVRDLGRLEEALKLIDIIIQDFPDNIRAQMVKGSILQKIPNLIEAINTYQKILAIEPKHLPCRVELARTYSQSGQVETAITFLEETYQLSGSNIHVLSQLGFLNQALEKFSAAREWYQEICWQYPYFHQGYCMLSNLFFLQGETETALQLLQEAQAKMPDLVPILIQLIELQMRLGNLDLSHQLLSNGLARFPHNIQMLLQLCSLYMTQGDYEDALNLLDKISTDNQDSIRQIEQLRANIYFSQYDYQKAETHFKRAIALAPIAIGERDRLATILMLTGRIDDARQEFKTATEELNLKTPPGKISIPLRSHPAMVTNELRINPPMMAQLQAVEKLTGYERILALGNLLAEEPTYLGTALYLARELRKQGIFAGIELTLSRNPTNIPTIPKRIVQFWDQPTPPEEVQRICQSWIDLNPEYEYTRFSTNEAIAFLQQHYDQQVLKAFTNCDQPATQADFFRLAYLNKMGGFYADADDLCCQSLDKLVSLNPELVVFQEDFASIGNNFLGCIPGQSMIRKAFDQAVNNLADYCNESPWFKTGPGLITSSVCSGLVPYLNYTDYRMWPRLFVLTQAQLKKIINQHLYLSYKRTDKSWQHEAYHRRIKVC